MTTETAGMSAPDCSLMVPLAGSRSGIWLANDVIEGFTTQLGGALAAKPGVQRKTVGEEPLRWFVHTKAVRDHHHAAVPEQAMKIRVAQTIVKGEPMAAVLLPFRLAEAQEVNARNRW